MALGLAACTCCAFVRHAPSEPKFTLRHAEPATKISHRIGTPKQDVAQNLSPRGQLDPVRPFGLLLRRSPTAAVFPPGHLTVGLQRRNLAPAGGGAFRSKKIRTFLGGTPVFGRPPW